jgi:hypothetical protein
VPIQGPACGIGTEEEGEVRKQGVKRGVKFEPSDYDHLDGATLEEFVSEFLSRNDQFRRDCGMLTINSHSFLSRYETALFQKYRVYLPSNLYTEQELQEYSRARKLKVVLAPPVRILLLHSNERKAFSNQVTGLLDILFGEPKDDGTYPCENTLLMAVNLNRPKDDIENEIEWALNHYRPSLKSKLRTDEWKYFLIAYDLTEQGHTSAEAADIMGVHYPEDTGLFDVTNINNFRKHALELINGGYKRYI